MGFFDWLVGRDASADWPEVGKQPLILRPGESSLNGIALGEPADKLREFGRPSNKRPFKEERFLYQQHGIVVEIENGKVSYFGLPVARTDSDPVSPCELTLVAPDGNSIPVNVQTDAATLLRDFPEPEETDVDGRETVYSIRMNGVLLELEIAPEGRVRRLNLYPYTG